MTHLDDKLIVLGVTGGIAAYRSCELARLLAADGARVQAVLTPAAAGLVTPIVFQALTGRPAETGWAGAGAAGGMPHIDLGRGADAIVVAPATANTLAKVACGMADNLLCALILASRCPVILAPAMNTRMWDDPATRDNVARLAKRERFIRVGPAAGSLACGEDGPGRMEEPPVILAAVRHALGPGDLAGRHLLVTAGPTREPVDPVRYLSNRSSGKMGYALAAAAHRRGAEVTLVTGPVALAAPEGVRTIAVESAAQMARAVDTHLDKCDALLMAAAVADFKPKRAARTKLKKARGAPTIELVSTRDILGAVARKRRGCVVVGFAAETGDPLPAARDKLARKKLDLVVANDVSRPDAGFDRDTNKVVLVDADGAEELDTLPKDQVAERILDRLVGLLAS